MAPPTWRAQAGLLGLGTGFLPECFIGAALRSGALVPLLGAWCPRVGGLQRDRPGRRCVPARLRARTERERERPLSLGVD